MRISYLFSTLFLALLSANGEIDNAQEVRIRSLMSPPRPEETFHLTAQVLSPCSDRTLRMSVQDDSGACLLGATVEDALALKLRRGDRVHIRGHLSSTNTADNPLIPRADKITLVARDTLPPPARHTAHELFRGNVDCQTIRLEGTVRDVLKDEIDPDFTFVILDADGETVYASILTRRTKSKVTLPAPGSRISVCGMVEPYPPNNRRHLTHYLYVVDPSDITLLESAPADPFAVPDIRTLSIRRPEDILAVTGRRRAHGTVVALWKKDTALIKMEPNRFLRAEFAQQPVPAYGTAVDVVGFPETDLYQINLSRAIWRKASSDAIGDSDGPARSVTLRELLKDPFNAPQIHPEYRGRLLSVCGTVKSLSNSGIDGARLYLENDGYLLPVELGSFPDAAERIPPGAFVKATGICILDLENWRPNILLPHIRGISLYLRKAKDLKILSMAPWWTRKRLFSALGILLLALVGFSVWNFLLRR